MAYTLIHEYLFENNLVDDANGQTGTLTTGGYHAPGYEGAYALDKNSQAYFPNLDSVICSSTAKFIVRCKVYSIHIAPSSTDIQAVWYSGQNLYGGPLSGAGIYFYINHQYHPTIIIFYNNGDFLYYEYLNDTIPLSQWNDFIIGYDYSQSLAINRVKLVYNTTLLVATNSLSLSTSFIKSYNGFGVGYDNVNESFYLDDLKIYSDIDLFPIITTIDPLTNIQSGALLRITGINLQGQSTTAVTINGVDYSSYITSSSSTLITMIAPSLSNSVYSLIIITDGFPSNSISITYSARSILNMPIRPVALYQHFENDDGTPLAFGLVYTYAARTSTPQYALISNDSGNPGSLPLVNASNPIVLDAAGNASFFLTAGLAYKIVVKTAAGATVSSGSQDNVIGTGDSLLGANTTVGTIPELRLLTAGSYSYVNVLGYYSKTDNIDPRLYYWDSASTTSDDEGSIIKITATATGRFKLVTGKRIDSKWFGVKGNGTTSDGPEIRHAINYLVAIGGGTLQFSYGAYNFTSTLIFPETVEVEFLPGAYLKSSNASALTINKMSMDGTTKRFDSTVSGAVGAITFGTGIDYVRPEWYGAYGDGIISDSLAIQAALTDHPKIELLSGKTYKLTTGLSLPVNRILNGNGCIFSPNADSINLLTLTDNTDVLTKTIINDIRITNGASHSDIIGMIASKSDGLTLNNIDISGVSEGLNVSGARNYLFNNVSINSCTIKGFGLTTSFGVGDTYDCIFNNIKLKSNVVGLFIKASFATMKNITFSGLDLDSNTINGAFFDSVEDLTINNLRLNNNGTGSSSITIDSSTIYKSDLYLYNSNINLNDSKTSTTLNNSIKITNSSTLITTNCPISSISTNTLKYCDETSRSYEHGKMIASGYSNGLQSYGDILSISDPYICDGVGLSIQSKGRNYFTGIHPQAPQPKGAVPAAMHPTRSDKGFGWECVYDASIGSDGTNSCSMTFSTRMSGSYQISTMLIRATTGYQSYTIKWIDDNSSYFHVIFLNSNHDSWRRLVFVSAGKATHSIVIFPCTNTGSTLYFADAMTWDGDLESISNIYKTGLVGIFNYGDYAMSTDIPITVGAWKTNDIIYTLDAFNSGYEGYVCSTSGTPGTWNPFGAVN